MLMTPHQAAAAVSLMIMHPLRLPLHHAAPLRPRTPQLLLKMMLQIQQAHLHLVRSQVVLAPLKAAWKAKVMQPKRCVNFWKLRACEISCCYFLLHFDAWARLSKDSSVSSRQKFLCWIHEVRVVTFYLRQLVLAFYRLSPNWLDRSEALSHPKSLSSVVDSCSLWKCFMMIQTVVLFVKNYRAVWYFRSC